MEIEEIKELIDKLSKELSELSNKIMKLENTLFSYKGTEKFTTNQLDLLNIQYMSMKTYFQVLHARIRDLENDIIKLKENKR